MKITLWLAGLSVLFCFAAPVFADEAGRVLTDVKGTVRRVNADWFGLVPDYDPGTRFAPDHLPPDLREDGLRVIFSGVIGEIPPGARMWGTPLRLTAIRRE